MALFVPNVPVTRGEPEIEVDSRELGVGERKFSLVVEGASGQRSPPAFCTLQVTPPERPVAVIDAPERLPRIQSLLLRGGRSVPPELQRLVLWTWTLEGAPFGTPGRITRETQAPQIEIPPLPAPGRIRVTLVVRDSTGAESAPDRADITLV